MSQIALNRMAERVADLLEQKMRIKGDDLAAKLARGGHRLPRKVRASVEILAGAAEMSQNPRLLKQVDFQAASQAYDICVRHLGKVGFWQRHGGPLQDWALSVLTAIAVLVALALVALRWRGLI